MSRRTLVLTLVLLACSTRAAPRTRPAPSAVPSSPDRSISVALPVSAPRVGATAEFRWLEGDGRTLVARGLAAEQWRVEREVGGPRVRAVRPDGVATAWHRDLIARVAHEGFVLANGKRYRGDIAVLPLDTGLSVVNRVGLEDYLRGVVPVEMGRRSIGDSAALQAQAVASRSYAVVRMAMGAAFDVRASTADQAYGGVDAENAEANAAVDATRGLVLRYDGRVVDAPYHSTCGGTTAEPDEIWRSTGARTPDYLRRVSDRIGGSERFYCDIAPMFRWTRALTGPQLDDVLARYLTTYAAGPPGGPGRARAIGVRDRTPSGRVAVLDVETGNGLYAVRANDIRYVLRQHRGEILPSTYFSVEPEYREGRVSRVTFRGQGNGHGVGMCQWGAIGRARAGQSFRSILGTYYPGTTVGPLSAQ